MRIRYADGSFSSEVQISSGISATSMSPSISYDDSNNCIYITYMRDGSVRARALNLADYSFSDEYTLFNPTGPFTITAAPYGTHIGILYLTGMYGYIEHGYLFFPWEWEDNNNDYYWMQNNVMPYSDYILLGIDGELVLEYQPETIIQGTTLPDEEGDDHPGEITWGDNPAGVTIAMSSLIPMDGGGTVPYVPASEPGLVPGSQDMTGPTGQPGWTDDIPSLTTHPFYPAVKVASDLTSIPVRLVWILGATFLLVLAMIVCFKYVPHQIITILVGGGMAAFFYSMGIYPFWVIFIFAVGGLAIILGERFPSVG